MDKSEIKSKVESFLSKGSNILKGKEKELKLSLICLLSDGHLLIEDIPGVGKTTLVYLMARLVDQNVSRIQFTNDLLPSDIIGFNVFNRDSNEFNFKKGPVFGHLILADELNRATPKTQSALLQVMEEREVSVEGENFKLDDPFFVLATQNPFEQVGTYALPESQLDRFFMGLFLGFPDRDSEKEILREGRVRDKISTLAASFNKEEFRQARSLVESVHIDDKIVDYILDILEKGRVSLDQGHAFSTRAGKNIVQAAKACALVEGRDFVTPEDVFLVTPNILGHRIGYKRGLQFGVKKAQELLSEINIRS